VNFSAVILAGGKSSRMGRDKAWLEVDGRPLLARQIQLARESGAAEVFISGRADTDYAAFGCRVLWDKFGGAGPLAGIERALDAAMSPLLLVLAVDLPEMSVEFLRRLGAGCAENFGAIPRVNENIEPLAAFYPKISHSPAEALLCNRRNAVATFAEHCVQSGLARFVELPAAGSRHFANWNAPVDLPCPT
jgi:molybdenum cofactor guanylyltransferase